MTEVSANDDTVRTAAQEALDLLTRLTLIPRDDELEQAREEGWSVTRTEVLEVTANLRAALEK